MRIAAIIPLSAVLALLLSACAGSGQAPGDGNNPGDTIAAIDLSPETASIEVGEQQAFTATAKNASGSPLNTVFNWTSSNTQVATVTNGVATGLAEGTTEITASAGGVSSDAALLAVTSSGNEGGADGRIAYVSADSWDEIRLINADGSGDRLLWSHGQTDPGDAADTRGIYNVLSLAWRPDGSEVAFASTHEMWCSLNTSDIFSIRTDLPRLAGPASMLVHMNPRSSR